MKQLEADTAWRQPTPEMQGGHLQTTGSLAVLGEQ